MAIQKVRSAASVALTIPSSAISPSAMVNVAFVTLDVLAMVLVVVPAPWHLSAWNTATCYMILWTTIGCLVHLVNCIVWDGNIRNPAPTYCDIATKLIVGLSIAIPLSSLCINRRLYNIATMETVEVSKANKRRNIIIETLIAILGPMIFMAIHYTMQGHRYDILENFGCWATTYNTAPAYVLVLTPPIVSSCISLIYASLALRAFIRRRAEFNHYLRSSSTGLTSSRYLRLMALATTEIALGLPASLYFFISNLVTTGVRPWKSWEDTHANFSRVIFVPQFFLRQLPATVVALEMHRWTFPFIGILFFALFGFGEEAQKHYRRVARGFLGVVGLQSRLNTLSPDRSTSLFGKSGKGRIGRVSSTGDAHPSTLPQYSVHTKPVDASAEGSIADFELELPELDTMAFEAQNGAGSERQEIRRGAVSP